MGCSIWFDVIFIFYMYKTTLRKSKRANERAVGVAAMEQPLLDYLACQTW
jgi:hypothetical protein